MFTSRVKNDEFRLGRMNSEFVSIKPRRNMRELYVKNGSQVIMTKKDICIISKGNDRQEVGDMKKITDVKRKSKGPRTEPWGTPKTTELYEEVWSWTMTHCCLHSRTLSPGVLGQGGDQSLLESEEEASTKNKKTRT